MTGIAPIVGFFSFVLTFLYFLSGNYDLKIVVLLVAIFVVWGHGLQEIINRLTATNHLLMSMQKDEDN
jgi:hypothetical protein